MSEYETITTSDDPAAEHLRGMAFGIAASGKGAGETSPKNDDGTLAEPPPEGIYIPGVDPDTPS